MEPNQLKAKGLSMNVGTKSILFGAHCWFLHPWFVAWAWWRLYGFPFDPRLWAAFFVHDLGYWGKPNMDGPEGETHVELGAWIMSLFGATWADLSRYHSRFYAKKDGRPFSALCVADKLAIVLTPAWLYLPLARATGEIHEYMELAQQGRETGGKYQSMLTWSPDQAEWYANVQRYLVSWIEEHKDGRQDTWTPSARKAKQ